ncbi:hypothetical protein OPAG_00152 [Rhodococcus opacus PD630]|uniref:hypothetical protein n=1 Tax=Rhodococcus opacus TaxID=37919 RepID=UPI00029CB417|nr:hypothetical protein [Rhodococcus opacus]AHK32946.1 hypothetical protein Pd630_LPD05755 [Rhodococcus opacus PD630]EHI41098.1 hypothetical protein OPAG_00152 [Rhodococcus opacus PD630]KXF56719.1 hypothetical protein AXA44_33055 [Rhodococcus sp. SC4]UDG95274.1 hypothetical protein K2Z90_005400 [Rhodococcus opacus PD630]
MIRNLTGRIPARSRRRQIAASTLIAAAAAVGTMAVTAPAAQAATFQDTCVTHPGAYASGAVLGVYATKRIGNDREESCKVYDAQNRLLGTTYQTNYGFYGKQQQGPGQINPPAQSPR